MRELKTSWYLQVCARVHNDGWSVGIYLVKSCVYWVGHFKYFCLSSVFCTCSGYSYKEKKNLFVLRAHKDFGTLYVWTLLENSRSGLIWSKIQFIETVKHDCYDGVWRARVTYVYSMFSKLCNSVSGSTQWHQLVFSVSRQRSVHWGGEAAADALPVWGVRACPVSTGKSLHAHILSQRWGKTSATRLTHTNAAHQSTTSQGHQFVLQLLAALFVPLCHRCMG